MPERNPEFISQLRQALALAEAGKITDGAIIGLGPTMQHHAYSVPHAPVHVIGEIALVQTAIEMQVIKDRAQQEPKSKLTVPPRGLVS